MSGCECSVFCVVGNSITTLSLLASRSSIFAPFFISCNGGVRSYSLSISPPPPPPPDFPSCNSGVRSYSPFIIIFPPIFRPATVVSEVGSVGKVTRVGFFSSIVFCLLRLNPTKLVRWTAPRTGHSPLKLLLLPLFKLLLLSWCLRGRLT